MSEENKTRALENMRKAHSRAVLRAAAFAAAAERCKSAKTIKPGDVLPEKDPADGEDWSKSALARHRGALIVAYGSLAIYWNQVAGELEAAIAREEQRLGIGTECPLDRGTRSE